MCILIFTSAEAFAARPNITTQPKSTSINVGNYIYLYTTLSNPQGVTYQWYKNNLPVAGGSETKPDGSTHFYFWVSSAQASDAGTYKVTFRNRDGSSTSSNATVTVTGSAPPPAPTLYPPVITAQPQGNTPRMTATSVQVNVGADYLYIFFTATSSKTMTYKWFRNGTQVSTGENIWVNPAQAADIGEYYVVVSNADGSTTSNKVYVTSTAVPTPTPSPVPAPTPQPTLYPPVITSQPQGNTPKVTATSVQVSVGADYLYIFFTATSSTPMTYKWFRNGTQVSTGENIWVNPAQAADIGEYYVVVSNTDGSVTSSKVYVTAAGSTPTPTPTPTPSPTPTPTPAPIPSGYTGLIGGCGSCDEHEAGVRSFENLLGRTADYLLVWGWAPTANDLMYSMHYLINEYPNRKLHYNVPMVLSRGTFQQIYSGSLDAVYRDVAQTIAANDPNAIVRMGHEMNGGGMDWGYDWRMDGPAGNKAEFAQAYRHLVNIFRSVSPNFKFVWNPGAGGLYGDFTGTYPGDAYVDYISFDIYELEWVAKSYNSTDRWNFYLDYNGLGLNWLASFAAQHGKKIAFDEWAAAVDDGFFITKMHEWMRAHSDQMAYHMYWDSEAAFSGSFAKHPVNAATYKTLFGK